MPDFLPVSREDMERRGIEQLDFVLVTGDAYVDHPSFGTAIIGRVLEDAGFTVGIISQPDWRSAKDFLRLGLPRYAFLCNSGNIDSMVNHYTAAKKRRSQDAYTPGGAAGKRPDRAVIVYSGRIREAAPGVPLLIGGIEASLRRFAHYDYWDDAVRRSILVDSGADLLMYGMGELSVVEIARRLAAGEPISSITDVRGTCVMVDSPEGDGILLPDFETLRRNKKAYASATATQYREQDAVRGRPLYQQHGLRFVKQNPPMRPLTTEEFDHVYELPYCNAPHPSYDALGGVPAIAEVEFSIIHNRGCVGACNFCALTLHQSRTVTSRSKQSILREARRLTQSPRFKGYIHDIGGPTANFRHPACQKQLACGACPDRRCLAPDPCPNLEVDHTEYLDILREVRALPGVKKVFVRSGLRFDYMLLDKDPSFFEELVKYHVSGQLKVAPEHISDNVLRCMGKPSQAVFDAFCEQYAALNRKWGLKQYLVPYLMSSHPGSRLEDAVALACYLKSHRLHPEQVQDFYPTPGTISTAMYYTGIDPVSGKPVYVARSPEEKAQQRALLQFFRPQNYEKVRAALLAAGRPDLIGSGPECLVPAAPGGQRPAAGKPASRSKKTELRAQRNASRPPKHGGRPTPRKP